MAHIIRVVIADPDPGLRLLVASQLAVDGRFQLIGEAGDADEVLRVCLSRAPDAVILDYTSINPMEVLPSIRQSLPDVTIICCSDRNGFLQDQAHQLGADAFITKSRTMTDDIISALMMAHPDSDWS